MAVGSLYTLTRSLMSCLVFDLTGLRLNVDTLRGLPDKKIGVKEEKIQ